MKGIARETLFIIIIGAITVSIIVYVLLVYTGIIRTENWTAQCNAKKYSYCADWSLRGWESGWDTENPWSQYAPNCPSWTPTQTECQSLVVP